jgi:hypothetical protein
MAQANRDQNHVTVALGASIVNETTLPFLVDPVSNRLLITIYPCPDEILVTGEYTDRAKRDQNHVPAGLAVTDDGNTDVKSLITPSDPTTQYLYCDVLIEP